MSGHSLNGASLAHACLQLIDKAAEEMAKPGIGSGSPISEYWRGISEGAKITLERFDSAWATLESERKDAIDPVRSRTERSLRNQRASEARNAAKAKPGHLGQTLAGIERSEATHSAETLCGLYLGSKGSEQRETHRLCRDQEIAAATCVSCLDEAANGFKTPVRGAFEQLQKIYRREEAAAKDRG